MDLQKIRPLQPVLRKAIIKESLKKRRMRRRKRKEKEVEEEDEENNNKTVLHFSVGSLAMYLSN